MLKDILRSAAAPLLLRCCSAAAPLLLRCCSAAAPLLLRCCLRCCSAAQGHPALCEMLNPGADDFVLSREGEEFSWEPSPAYPYPLLNMYPPILVIISCFVSFVIKAAQRRKCVRSRHYSSCVRASPLQSLNLNTTCPWMSLPHCLSFIDDVYHL